jgi:protein required for attachment to host cells
MNWSIVVADGGRARLFTAKLRNRTGDARLIEEEDLVEPERGLLDREIFSDRSGQNRPGAGFAEHRAQHRDEVARRFAKRIAEALARRVRRDEPDTIVVVAAPRLLGLLRGPLDAALPGAPPRIEVGADLTWQALPKLHGALMKLGILPRGNGRRPPRRKANGLGKARRPA